MYLLLCCFRVIYRSAKPNKGGKKVSDDILYDLYWGELRPGEKRPDRPEEIQRLEKRFASSMREIANAAGGDAVKRLDDLLSDRNTVEAYYASVDFVRGFKLGVKFMVAVFQQDQNGGDGGD